MKNFTISDYYMLDSRIDKRNTRNARFLKQNKVIKVSLLGSFNLKGIKEALNVKCDEQGLILESYVGTYKQYNQEILDKNSPLYRFNPHLTILLLDIKDIIGDYYYFPYRLPSKKRKILIKDKIKELSILVKAFAKNCKGKLLLNNFSTPYYSPMGILENKQNYGYFEMIDNLNRLLENKFKNNSQVYIYDYDNLLNKWGKYGCIDDKMSYLADFKLDQNFIPTLCNEYMRYIKAIKGKIRKCLIMDLDNTLWGGIIGEDGFEGIRLGPDSPGNTYMEFQKYILSLFERGIILAINSNNNSKEALKVIEEHPYMILRKRHFASLKINWSNKAGNIIDIAKEINIGLDSIVYIDDDKTNRQIVQKMLPDVFVLDLPEDPALYSRALKEYTGFDALQFTKEDARRGLSYAQEKKRRELRESCKSIDGYLAHLDIHVKLEQVNKFSLSRVSQLAQRTNQFNLTSRRLTEEDIGCLIKQENYRIYSIAVKDNFGDSGIIGMISIKNDSHALFVDNFFLSCKILGRKIENSIVAAVARLAKKRKMKYLIFEYSPNEKNEVVKEFLKSYRPELIKKQKGLEYWKICIGKCDKQPKYITIELE